jgi:hypothetical protein
MLITSERKASRAKKVYMVCLVLMTFGGAWLTMIVDNAPAQPVPAKVGYEGPLRRLVGFMLAAVLLCAGLYFIFTGRAGAPLAGAYLILVGGAIFWEDLLQ